MNQNKVWKLETTFKSFQKAKSILGLRNKKYACHAMQSYQFIIYVKCINWQVLNSYEN
jgi:hypothetical protein